MKKNKFKIISIYQKKIKIQVKFIVSKSEERRKLVESIEIEEKSVKKMRKELTALSNTERVLRESSDSKKSSLIKVFFPKKIIIFY